MSENWAIALVVFCLGEFGATISAGIIGYFILHSKISDARIDSEHRFTALEIKIEKWFVITGSTALHSPNDHLGADRELETFVMDYRQHNHELPSEKWFFYRGVFKRIMDNPNATANEKVLADGFVELCEHKLMASGLLVALLAQEEKNKSK